MYHPLAWPGRGWQLAFATLLSLMQWSMVPEWDYVCACVHNYKTPSYTTDSSCSMPRVALHGVSEPSWKILWVRGTSCWGTNWFCAPIMVSTWASLRYFGWEKWLFCYCTLLHLTSRLLCCFWATLWVLLVIKPLEDYCWGLKLITH